MFINTDKSLKDQTRLLMLRWFARDTAHIRVQPDNICVIYVIFLFDFTNCAQQCFT